MRPVAVIACPLTIAVAIIGVPFSQLVQQPRETVARLEESPRRRLRLERRDGRDLILESADRAEADDKALNLTGRLFFQLMKTDKGARWSRCLQPGGELWEPVLSVLEHLVVVPERAVDQPPPSVVWAWSMSPARMCAASHCLLASLAPRLTSRPSGGCTAISVLPGRRGQPQVRCALSRQVCSSPASPPTVTPAATGSARFHRAGRGPTRIRRACIRAAAGRRRGRSR